MCPIAPHHINNTRLPQDGVCFMPLDLSVPLERQLPFHVLLHKASDELEPPPLEPAAGPGSEAVGTVAPSAAGGSGAGGGVGVVAVQTTMAPAVAAHGAASSAGEEAVAALPPLLPPGGPRFSQRVEAMRLFLQLHPHVCPVDPLESTAKVTTGRWGVGGRLMVLGVLVSRALLTLGGRGRGRRGGAH